ncbi:MAG: hypothetical protein Q6373_019200 [Candidatus Sigynarchaeota archaeon]
MAAAEMPTYETDLDRLPATFLDILGVAPPADIPPPVKELSTQFKAERIVFALFDNLGLFELSQYKPQFLIEMSNALALLNTKNPYTLGVMHQILYAGLLPKVGHPYKPNGFHLLKYLNENGHKTTMIGRPKDLRRYSGNTEERVKDSDMATWVEAARVINTYSLSWLHFLDFEGLADVARQRGQNLDELVKRLLLRTDKWMTSMFRQLRASTLLVICGDHGRYKITITGEDKVAQMRAASVPVAVFIKK